MRTTFMPAIGLFPIHLGAYVSARTYALAIRRAGWHQRSLRTIGPGELRIDRPVPCGWDIARARLPDNIALPSGPIERTIYGGSAVAALNNVVGDYKVRGAKAAFSSSHYNIRIVVEKRIAENLYSIRPVVGRKFCRRDFAVTIADLDCGAIVLEIVAEDFVVVAEDTQSAMRPDEKVSINKTSISVAQRYLGAILAERIEAVRVVAGFIANRALVFATGFHKEIMFHQAMCRRQASRTVPDV